MNSAMAAVHEVREGPAGELHPQQTGLMKGGERGDTALTGVLLSPLKAHGHCLQGSVWLSEQGRLSGAGGLIWDP